MSEPTPPPKKSSYASFAENSTRNVVWALGLTLGVVVLVAIVHFGFGSEVKRETPETSRVDLVASAERAKSQLPFEPAAPSMPEGWSVRQAKMTAGAQPNWTVTWTSPREAAVQLVQVKDASAEQLNAVIPGARPTGEKAIGSTTCNVVEGSDADAGSAKVTGLVCPAHGSSIIVSGRGQHEELATVATAALSSTGKG